MAQDRAERFEAFVVWYLRFNGYFTVPNFVVHAGDDQARISGEVVGNKTEVDTIAVRFPYSREASGTPFPTDKNLVEGAGGRFDVVFAEVKSGRGDSPNKIWRNGEVADIEYLLRFLGWHNSDDEIREAATALSQKFIFEADNLRIRYIIFADRVDSVWNKKGVTYVTFDDCVRFISEERGQCWAESGIGRRSMHDQWSTLAKKIFEVANSESLTPETRQHNIRDLLENGS